MVTINCLFVYGTFIFEDQDPSHGIDTTEIIDETKTGWVEGKLYQTGGFPFLVLEGDDKVKGKLFRCCTINPLIKTYDKIEGVNEPNPFFERVVTDVELERGNELEAYVYVAGSYLKNKYMKPKNRITTGCWLDWLKNNI